MRTRTYRIIIKDIECCQSQKKKKQHGPMEGMERIKNQLKMVALQVQRMSKIRSLGIVTVGAAVVAIGYSYLTGNTKTSVFRTFVMPAVRILPAETSHNLAVWACKHKFYPTSQYPDDLNLHTKFFGRLISNPIGIAAGFDKNGEAIEGLQEMGFGFVEVGTVTPMPQQGNPAPRVFRLTNDRAIINRYGFNSEGHQRVLERVQEVKKKEDLNIVVGVNLGQNRRTKSSIDDYVKGVETFGPVVDYLVINISSPNTRGLRDLQTKGHLERLLENVNLAREKLEKHSNVPIFLKLSPDLDVQELKDIVSVINRKKCGVDGLILSNTTISRNNLTETQLARQTGGLSGAPLRERSTQMIALAYELTKGKVPIIGVGGVSSGEDAYEKIEAGASFVQFYTALAYEGPEVVKRIKNDLSQLIQEFGYDNVQDVVGSNYRAYLPRKY